MKKLIAILFTFHLSLFTLFAQKEIKRTWNWYFGNYAGLNFSSGAPVAITNAAMVADDGGVASISDTSGNLLFYTNGQSVWNKNNVIMPNGTGIGAQPYLNQNVIIVPQPMNDSIYYIFTDSLYGYTANYPGGFKYSTVNMNLNGGLGDVVKKEQYLLFNPSKLAGVRCSNDTDIWIVTIRIYTDSFFVYRLTPKGLDTVPIISKCGRSDSVGEGCMKFSPSGGKLALAIQKYYGVEILDFNDTTGKVYSSHPIDFPPGHCDPEGVEFSPDESKLYWTYDNLPGKYIYQVNLNAGSDSAIINSATLIDSAYTPNGAGLGDLQLGPDGKIYVAKVVDGTIAAIDNPNLLGKACNYIDSAVYLGGGSIYSFYGLPNYVSGYFYSGASPQGLPVVNTHERNTLLYPNPNNGVFNFYASDLGGKSEIEIYNLLGEKIYSHKLNASNNVINIKRQSSGVYLYRVYTEAGDFVSEGKFIVE
jgi:hypothetical protein